MTGQVQTQYGKIGSNGQTTLKDCGDDAAAVKFMSAQHAAKQKKGYADASDPLLGPSSGSKRKAAGAKKPAAKKTKKAPAKKAAAKQSSLNGKLVCFTGTLENGTRADAKTQAEAAGAKVGARISGKTDILVTGTGVGATKIAEAHAKGIQVWDEDTFTAACSGIQINHATAVAGGGGAKKKAAPKKKKAAPAVKPVKPKNKQKGSAKAGLSGLGGPEDDALVEDVDSGVAAINAEVAEDGTVYEDYSARLVNIDVANNTDKYYILQLIEAEDAENYYVFRRSGRTGSAGQGQLDGPLELDAAEAKFEKLFASKSGQTWTDRDPTHIPANPKVYTYLKQDWGAREDEEEGQWMYHLTADPHGKPDGWYPYDATAGDGVEELYQTYKVDGNVTMSTRFVHAASSGFTYKVDLTKNTQTNVSSNKERPIRRDAL